MPSAINACRICGNVNLEPVLDLGVQSLTGVFPRKTETKVTEGPLRLVKCFGEDACGLLQLEHSYDAEDMYGDNYGYRSGLNTTMVSHLAGTISRFLESHPLREGSLVIDIGSNDSTTLQAFQGRNLRLIGIDPSGSKFKQFYPKGIELIPDFFSEKAFRAKVPQGEAALVTSFAMFYDLEDPLTFMKDLHSVLEEGGLWLFEQSYMPTMLAKSSYDTVCHEHIEYYAMKQIVWMADRVGFSIVDFEFNDINGGSFSVLAKKTRSTSHSPKIYALLEAERRQGLDTLSPYVEFENRVLALRTELISFLQKARESGKTVCALGASTKGNVILQYCGLDTHLITEIGEVNEEKVGAYTPGSLIPIISEREVLAKQYDYHLVLPWHFFEFFQDAKAFKGRTLLFPLPTLRVHRC